MKNICTAAISALGVAALALTACSPSQENPSTSAPTAAETTTVESTTTAAPDNDKLQGEGDIRVESAAIRAKAEAGAEDGKSMTGFFGTLHNTSDKDIHIVGFTTSLGDATYEIHEVVDGVMREKDGGIEIPAGGTYELKPGGDHFMIMGFDPAIPAGDVVDVTLEFADGTEEQIPDVAVRSMLPGDEDYGEHGELQGHQHGSMGEGHNH